MSPSFPSIDGLDKVSNPSTFLILFCASQKGLMEVVRVLLNDKRVDANQARLDDKTTAIYMASHYKQTETMKELVKAEGIDLNQPNMNGCSPLWISCAYGNAAGVEVLLQQPGIDVNLPTQWGTAYDMAINQGHDQIAKILLKNGARKDIPQLPPQVRVQQRWKAGADSHPGEVDENRPKLTSTGHSSSSTSFFFLPLVMALEIVAFQLFFWWDQQASQRLLSRSLISIL